LVRPAGLALRAEAEGRRRVELETAGRESPNDVWSLRPAGLEPATSWFVGQCGAWASRNVYFLVGEDARLPVQLADVFGRFHDASVDLEAADRGVHNAANKMRMSKSSHCVLSLTETD
jgi:hypothetical protein